MSYQSPLEDFILTDLQIEQFTEASNLGPSQLESALMIIAAQLDFKKESIVAISKDLRTITAERLSTGLPKAKCP
jgi:hypothetical protein